MTRNRFVHHEGCSYGGSMECSCVCPFFVSKESARWQWCARHDMPSYVADGDCEPRGDWTDDMCDRTHYTIGLVSPHSRKTKSTLVCETHPWLSWPHDDCGGPGAPPAHAARLLREAVELHQQAALRGRWESADWLDTSGLECPVSIDTGGY